MKWTPIKNLPDNWQDMSHPNLHAIAEAWKEEKERLQSMQSYQHFLEKMRRKIAIETGIIERLYTIDRGITQLLIEQGIDTSLIPHGKTDKPATEVVRLIRDHQKAVDSVFDFVGSQRNLSTSFIKQLHQLLTRNQKYTEGVDSLGNYQRTKLRRGEWKKQPDNPVRPDGTVHEYCPPEHVDSEMDRLIQWHHEHLQAGVSPEIEAAWLHHRFTQIHPFQDGNGRVARNLASLVFIKHEWFPLVVLDDQHDENTARSRYISALENADRDNLQPLIDLFAENQRKTFRSSLSLSEEAISEYADFQAVLQSAVSRIEEKKEAQLDEALKKAHQHADVLFQIAEYRLNNVKEEINVALKGISNMMDNAFVKMDQAKSDDENAHYYRYQIIEIANFFDYYANLSNYRSWLRLAIRTDDLQTEILISFHGLGYQARGIMTCSACAYRRFSTGETDSTEIEALSPLSENTFDFTHHQSVESLRKQFEAWLDTVIVAGVKYWRRGL
jgi:Fic family protein